MRSTFKVLFYLEKDKHKDSKTASVMGAYHGQWQCRVRKTWMRYCKCIDYLRAFMDKEYRVQDMPLAVLEQSFVEKFHAYLFLDKGLLPGGLICYLKCLKYVVKIAVCLNMWFLNSRNN